MQGYDIYLRNEFPVFAGDIIVFKDKIINIGYVLEWYSNTMDCVIIKLMELIIKEIQKHL